MLSELRGEISKAIHELINGKGSVSDEEAIDVVKRVINQYIQGFEGIEIPEPFSGPDIKYINSKIEKDFTEASTIVFEELSIDEFREQLMDLVSKIYVLKVLLNDLASGIVFFGFGEEEVYPSYVEFSVFTILNNSLKCIEKRTGEIDALASACISSFAQGDVIETFMEGVAPDLRDMYEEALPHIFEEYGRMILEILKIEGENKDELKKLFAEVNEDIIKQHSEKIYSLKYTKHIAPVLDIVSYLPKAELAELAESLVNITSIKRRVSNDAESVGGPIDVAVVSKGDGFIWVKRKHYFDVRLNHHFNRVYFNDEVE